MLDERYSPIPTARGDDNDYILGRIGDHNVVVVGPARGGQGTIITAQFVATVHLTFPNVKFGLLVGIGGGVPHYPEHDVRLDDVVVGAPEADPAVVHYNLGKRTIDGTEPVVGVGTLAKPPAPLLRVINNLEERHLCRQDGDAPILKGHLDRLARYPRLKKQYLRPSVADRLFNPDYIHPPGSLCTDHDPSFEVIREPRATDAEVNTATDDICVHYSTILSGDLVMKSSADRDTLSRRHNNALCFEMEAAGLMDVFPCLVIGGVCDYADSHKSDVWQRSAAAVAAAYAREVLLNLPSRTPVTRAATGPAAFPALSYTLPTRTRSQSAQDQDSHTLSQRNKAADNAARDHFLSQSSAYANIHSTPSVGPVDEHVTAEYLDRKVGSNIGHPSPRLTTAKKKEHVHQVKAQVLPCKTAGIFRKASSIDILFLIGATRLMQNYIDAARDQIESIVREIKEAFLNETEVRIAVVSYMDHHYRENSIRFLDFVTDPNQVSTFLGRLKTSSDEVSLEDVLGGIKCAINASWKSKTRWVWHIGEAPDHGDVLHEYDSVLDEYYHHGSEPHRPTYTPLLQNMVRSRLNYAFVRITEYTDRMILKFSEIYAAAGADVKLSCRNEYYSKVQKSQGNAGSSLWRGSRNIATAELQFLEMHPGTSYSILRHLRAWTVMRSAFPRATDVRNDVTQESRAETGPWKPTVLNKPSTIIKEFEDQTEAVSMAIPSSIVLEKVSPQWTVPAWFKDSLSLEGFCPDTAVYNASTLDEMMAADNNIKLNATKLTVRKRPRPFAEGSIHLAYYALTSKSTNKFVIKTFKTMKTNAMAQMIENMRAHALCKAFALAFNSLLKEMYDIDFIIATSWHFKARGSALNGYLSLEPFLDGEYVEYNNNGGWFKEQDYNDPFNDAAQAFTHFTYERSFGTCMVSNLQGCGHVFTDPAIHTNDPERFKLSPTNHNVNGFKFFFATHECNAVCAKLGLQSRKEMFIHNNWKFREVWPTMNNTVLCSNKLCQKITRVVNAQTTTRFPDCHWCAVCWPQLIPTTVSQHCASPGPHHVFDVSLFYYESQGQLLPVKCPSHLEKDTTRFTPTAVDPMSFYRISSVYQRPSTPRWAW